MHARVLTRLAEPKRAPVPPAPPPPPPPPPADPYDGWGPPDAYGHDWSDHDDEPRYERNVTCSVALDLRTWDCRGRVRARLRVINETWVADHENERNIERAMEWGPRERESIYETQQEQRDRRATAAEQRKQEQREQQQREASERQQEREARQRREQAAGPPPRREDDQYQHANGDEQFRSERALWYRAFTGRQLTGSLGEQNEEFDDVARRFRAYSDGREQRVRAPGCA